MVTPRRTLSWGHLWEAWWQPSSPAALKERGVATSEPTRDANRKTAGTDIKRRHLPEIRPGAHEVTVMSRNSHGQGRLDPVS